MAVIATAGHVDHGKSTLVQALTGRDPDRWAEEKRRGLTIDLGFAWTDLGEAGQVAFVDVPGHHRFIGNMLAGVSSVAAVLLVVAADEGWKEQSEEHLAILDLLGVERAVVALSKIDRVNGELRDRRIAEVTTKLSGTALAGAEIVAVSTHTGEGLDRLREMLAAIVTAAPNRNWPRMWIDRSFSVAGAGTVVTGTLLGGSIAVGEEMELWPAAEVVRVRGLESHEETRVEVGPEERVAINLAGVSAGEVGRGSLIGRPQTIDTSDRFLVSLRSARFRQELDETDDWLLYLGTLVTSARLTPLGSSLALIRTERPVPTSTNDRFVLRDTGRNLVGAGGLVLHPHPPRPRKEATAIGARLLAVVGDLEATCDILLEGAGTATLLDLAAWSGGGRPSPGTLEEGGIAYSGEAARALTDARAAAELAKEEQVQADSSLDDDPTWILARSRLEAARWAPPTIAELAFAPDLFRRLVATGRLVRIAPDLIMLPATMDDLPDLKDQLPGWFTVAEFRNAAGNTRRHAVPLLEYLGREGVTLRRGELHSFRPRTNG